MRRSPRRAWGGGFRVTATPAMPSADITSAMGSAVSVPAMPTSGATTAPDMNWMTPSSAEAAPATSGWSARASAVAFGSANANEDTMTKSGTITAHAPRPPLTMIARSTSDAVAVASIARRRISSEPIRPAIRELIRLEMTSPSPLNPNTTL